MSLFIGTPCILLILAYDMYSGLETMIRKWDGGNES